MRSRLDNAFLTPEDINLLQDCFDSLLKAQEFARESEEANATAKALVLAFQRGVRGKADLLRLAQISSLAHQSRPARPER